MSKKVYRANVGAYDNNVPLKFVGEKPVQTGDGRAAFKSVTAAVKAAEREKEKAVEAAEVAQRFAVCCSERLTVMEDYVRRTRRCMVVDAVCTLVMVGVLVVYMWFS